MIRLSIRSVFCYLLVLAPIMSIDAEELHPRRLPPKVTVETPTVPGNQELIVKFKDNWRVRMDGDGYFVSLEGKDVTHIRDSCEEFRLRFNPLLRTPPEKLDLIESLAELRSGRAQPDFAGIFSLLLAADEVPEGFELANRLQALEAVELAYFRKGEIALPADIPPVTSLYVAHQSYLEADEVTGGLNVEFAWSERGLFGSGVEIADIEFDWNLSHEDLDAVGATLLGPMGGGTPESNRNHGTAVAGIVAAPHNEYGINGIAPASSAHFYSITNSNVPDAIMDATSDLKAGGIILIELATDSPDIDGEGAELPVDIFDFITWLAIRSAVDSGYTVVEPAGNGNANLDSATYATYQSWGDNGAIMVGAGEPTSEHVRADFSTYGSRVDVHSWGRNVFTLGYGDFAQVGGPDDEDQFYTDSFSGTSSASALITGVAALLQERSLQLLGEPLSPERVRRTLKQTGLPQGDPENGHIGPFAYTRSALLSLETENDDFEQALIVDFGGQYLANNTYATRQPDEPEHGGGTGSHSLWWVFSPSEAGDVTVSTTGSAFDTALAVYTGLELSNLTTVAAINTPGGTEQLSFSVDPVSSTTHFIAVDGASQADVGDIIVTIDFDAAPCVDCMNPPAVSTDNATNTTQASARLNMAVNPGGTDTDVWFVWEAGDPTPDLNQTPTVAIGDGSVDEPFSSTISGLSCSTTYFFQANASNSEGMASGSVNSFTTDTCGGGGSTQTVELLQNGGFEQDDAFWTTVLDFYADDRFGNPHTGAGYAYVSQADGSPGNDLVGILYQNFSIPSNATSASVSFWHYITTDESPSGSSFDFLNVTLQDGAGNFLETIAFLSNLDSTPGYVQCSFDLDSSYIGDNLRIHFLGTTDSSLPTVFRVDDVSVTAEVPDTEPPDVFTIIASGVTDSRAELNGQVNPNGLDTLAWFDFEANDSTPDNPTESIAMGMGTNLESFSVTVTGLACDTQYFFEANASNSAGANNGIVRSFTTDQCPGDPPIVDTDPATSISLTGAQLNAEINPNGASTTAWFEWGATPSLGTQTASQNAGSGSSFVPIFQSLSGLDCGTTYYFSANAQNSFGNASGDIHVFQTVPCEPDNLPPTALDDAYVTQEDTPLSVSAPGVLGNDTDPEGDVLSAVLVQATANGALSLNADGSFSYSPTNDFAGADSFTYRASDSELLSNTATVTISVTPVNDAPVLTLIEPDGIDDDADSFFVITWTDSDSDDDASIELRYSDSATCAGSQAIVSGLSEDDPTDAYSWNTQALKPGEYWIEATIDDGAAVPGTDCSDGPVSIDHTQIFGDSFESGDTTSWSDAVGQPAQSLAISLDRDAGQYLTLPGTGIALTSDFTIALWVRSQFTEPAEENVLLSKWGQLASDKAWLFTYQRASQDQMTLRLFAVPTASDDDVSVQVNYTLPLGDWTHLAVVKSNTTATFYANGVSIGSGGGLPVGVNQTAAAVQLGIRNDEPITICDCDFDEAHVYDRALLGSEIVSLVSQRCDGTATNLEACWTFEGTFEDSSTNMEDFIPINSPDFITDGPALRE